MKRVLAFFGAFNPPTVAHVELARHAMLETGREGVVFVPSKAAYIRNEQGKDFAYTDAQRLGMLHRLAEGRDWMEVTDRELRAEAQPRSYDTLCALRAEGYDPALLLGSDKLGELEHIWLHVEDIAWEFGFVCVGRGTDACEKLIAEDAYLRSLAPYIHLVEAPEALRDVSSTAVRKRLSQIRQLEAEVRQLVPEEILPLL